MNRLCNKLRERLTPEYLDQLLLISQEGPDKLSRKDLCRMVYLWYDQKPEHIQLPHTAPSL